MRSNVEASRHYEDLFKAELASLEKLAASATSGSTAKSSAKAPTTASTIGTAATTVPPLNEINIFDKILGQVNRINSKVTSRPGMAILGAGIGATGALAAKYLYDKIREPDADSKDVIEALARAEYDRKNARLRELGIAGASLAAGLVLPEVARMGSRAIPFANSDFDADDIRKMMRD